MRRPFLRGLLVPVLRRAGGVAVGEARIFVDQKFGHLSITHADGQTRNLEALAAAGANAGDLAVFTGTRWRALAAGTAAESLHVDTRSPDGVTWEPWPAMATRIMRRGYWFWDDFEHPSSETGEHGRWGWLKLSAGSGGTVGPAAPDNNNWTECGIVKLTSGSSAGDGPAITQGSTTGSPYMGPPPTGARFICKARIGATNTHLTAYIGLNYSGNTPPRASNAVHAIGFVARATGAGVNWHGYTRKGTAESVIDLGVLADNQWRELQFRKTATGVQFMVSGVDVGAEITANIPAVTKRLGPTIGIVAESAATRELYIDYVGLSVDVQRFT